MRLNKCRPLLRGVKYLIAECANLSRYSLRVGAYLLDSFKRFYLFRRSVFCLKKLIYRGVLLLG
jgi:hypothetical protein